MINLVLDPGQGSKYYLRPCSISQLLLCLYICRCTEMDTVILNCSGGTKFKYLHSLGGLSTNYKYENTN